MKFRVSPETKADIDQYLDESNDFDSIARLCRTCVKNHIHTQTDSTPSDEFRAELDAALDPLREELERMNDRLADLEQTQTPHPSQGPDLDDLATDLFQSLPKLREWEPIPSLDDLSDEIHNPDTLADAQAASTARAWANYYDLDEEVARRALARVLDYYPDTTAVEASDGRRRYYRVTQSQTEYIEDADHRFSADENREPDTPAEEDS